MCRNMPNTSPKMAGKPLLQRWSDGEVFAEHLTIGKADKQRDSVRFGEVLACISMKTLGGEVVPYVVMVRMKVTDGL